MFGEAGCHIIVDTGWQPKSKRTSLVEGGALVDLEGLLHSLLNFSFFHAFTMHVMERGCGCVREPIAHTQFDFGSVVCAVFGVFSLRFVAVCVEGETETFFLSRETFFLLIFIEGGDVCSVDMFICL